MKLRSIQEAPRRKPSRGFLPPKPKRARKPKAPIEDLSEDQQAIRALESATRRVKAQHAAIYSQAKPATQEQVERLSVELGSPPFRLLLRFVEWSNGLHGQYGSLTTRPDKVFLSRIYWHRALQMAIYGNNEFGTWGDLFAQDCGYADEADMNQGNLFPELF